MHTSSFCVIAFAAAVASTGCASSMAPVQPIRLADIHDQKQASLPMLIEFREGDRVRLQAAVQSDLVKVEPAPQPQIAVVQRRFFVYVDKSGGFRISLDGKTFAKTHGGFLFGLGNTKDGPTATIGLLLKDPQ